MPVNRNVEQVVWEGIDNLSGVTKQAQSSVAQLRTSIDTVKGALAGIGVTVGAGAMIALYRDTLKAVAALDDMAESTGASVEGLSAIQRVARVGGHDFEGLTGQIGKMIKGLKDGDEQGGKTARALAHLGISARDTNGNFRDTSQILVELADRLVAYKDDGSKVLLVQDALGKGAERYLPLLKDMAEKTDLHATVTAKQAEEADRAEKNIRRLTLAYEDSRRELVNEYVPALNEFLEKLLLANRAAGGLVPGLATMFRAQPDGDIRARIKEIDEKIAGHEGAIANNSRGQGLGGKFLDLLATPGKTASGISIGRLMAERDYLEKIMQQRERSSARSGAGDPNSPLFEFGGQPAGYTGGDGGGAGGAGYDMESLEARRQAGLEQLELEKKLAAARQAAAELEARAGQRRLAMQDEIEAKANEIQQRANELAAEEIARIQGIGRTEEQQAIVRYRARLRMLELAMLDQETFNEAAQALEQEHQNELGRIRDEAARRHFQITKIHQQLDLDSARTFFGYMSGLMNTQSRKMFEIGKAAAIGETIINTYAAAMGAWKSLSSIPIVGYGLGAAAAGAVVASGLANVQRIRATQFGGGTGAVGTFPASPTTGISTAQPGGGAGAASKTVIIKLVGGSAGDRALGRNIIETVNDSLENGAKLIVAD